MSNLTAEDACPDQDLITDFWIRVAFSVCYLVIFIIGVVGNLLVIVVVVSNKAMHSPTNVFIVNMAMSDIFMCLFAVPFTPIHAFMDEWVLGNFLCKLFPSSQGISVYMSTLTLTCIAVDRYIAIVHPYIARMENKTAMLLALGVNSLAIMFTAPYFWYMTVYVNESGTQLCTESSDSLYRSIYGTFVNITQFVLPFTSIFVCYSVIMIKLAKRQTSRPGVRQSLAKEEQERERRKKTNRLCIAMVVIFGICWLPLNMINFVNDIDLFQIYCWQYYHFTFFLCHILAMSSNCYNPFLYGLLNDAFRQEFMKMLPFLATVCGGNARQEGAEGNLTRHSIRQEQNGKSKLIKKAQPSEIPVQNQNEEAISLVNCKKGPHFDTKPTEV